LKGGGGSFTRIVFIDEAVSRSSSRHVNPFFFMKQMYVFVFTFRRG